MMFLESAYDDLGLPLYIACIDSYEIRYINKEGKKLWGDITGRRCYEALNGTETVCEGCSKQRIEEAYPRCAKSRYLSAIGKYVDTYESITTLPDGTRARLCLVVDITKQEQLRQEGQRQEQAQKDMQHLLDIQSGFIGSAKSMMSAATLSGRMIFVNRAMTEALGFSQKDMLGMGIGDFHPPEVAQEFVKTYIPQCLADGSWKGDSLILKSDGTYLPVRQSIFPIVGEAGEVIATAAIMEDISQIVELERMNRYQLAIMDSSTSYIGVSDLQGNTMYHSPGAYRMRGYEPGETDEWDKRDPHPDWYVEKIMNEGIPAAMKEGQWIGQGELIDRYGKHIPIEQTIFPVFDENRQPMGVATIIRDTTEQLRQEKLIDAGRRTLRVIIDTVPSAIFWKDKNSRLLGANRQFANDAGIDEPDKIIGMTDYDFYPKELADQYTTVDREVFETGNEIFHVEEPFQGADGTTYWVSTSKVLIRDESGEPYAILGVYDDITKTKQNEMKLECAMKEAEEASRAKGDFLSRMSHEIRTPMNAIKGLAELLALTELNSVQDNYVHNIVKSSNSLLSIINDVLDFSKISENKLDIVLAPYALSELIAEVCNAVSLRATEKKLNLLTDIAPDLPQELIGDDVRIRQVLINILNNAVKYTHQGQVILRLRGEEGDGGFQLVCTVEDTGIGIREEDIPSLFEAFAQADRQANRNIQGTGLGLSISDRLVRSMGGTIGVESQYGKGSTFTVRFPQGIGSREPLAAVEAFPKKHVLLLGQNMEMRGVLTMLEQLEVPYTFAVGREAVSLAGGYTHCIYDESISEEEAGELEKSLAPCIIIALRDMQCAARQTEACQAVLLLPLLITELAGALALVPGQQVPQAAGLKLIDDFSLTDTRILVVDDNEINLLVGEEIFRAYQADVTCANGGRTALELCQAEKYDLIFMDHTMPEMDGIETTIALRQGDSNNKATPIIALTANVVNDMAQLYLDNGMDDFISKPIEINDLRRVLLHWLPKSKIKLRKQ